MKIVAAEPADVVRIFELYDAAIEFQKQVFDKHWLGFDAHLANREIAEGRLWKILEGGRIACIYSLAYEDPIIWGEDSGEGAMYLHRIVTDSKFRSRGYIRTITEWAIQRALDNGLAHIRMDTWSDNRKLIEHYLKYGYRHVGDSTPAASPDLPAHYRGISLALLELDVASAPSSRAGPPEQD